MPQTAKPSRPDYGIDAPAVVRNLSIAGLALLAISLSAIVGLLPAAFQIPGTTIRIAIMGLVWPGIGFSSGALWMYWGSRIGKIRERERLLDRITWRGDERVLDIGCGRGLMLVGAAKRAPRGSAVGVDIWQAEDLSDNRAEVPMRNAEIEGVGDRVSVETADMRHLPFPDRTFDVVVSRAAIHNLYAAPDRAAAIREIARVLKPWGRAVISDIRHHQEYIRIFAENGCPDVRLLDSRLLSLLATVCTMGSLRPNTTMAIKAP